MKSGYLFLKYSSTVVLFSLPSSWKFTVFTGWSVTPVMKNARTYGRCLEVNDKPFNSALIFWIFSGLNGSSVTLAPVLKKNTRKVNR